MPYIAVTTSLKLSKEQKNKLNAEFGRLIPLIPTKTEAGLLVAFSDDLTMYRAGEEAPCAFVEIRLFGTSEFEGKKEFTKAVFEMLHKELGLEIPRIYINILEFNEWGTRGDYITK